MSYMKSVRSGAEGNTSLLKSYGGGSTGPRQCYATGGAVGLNKAGPALSEGLSAAGTPAKPSLARPGRKIGKKKDAKTNINVIVAGASPKEAPMPPMGGPPPGPPMPPPGAGPGGPPMPMRANGGRVGYKIGGKVKRADGGSTISEDSKRKARAERMGAVRDAGDAAAEVAKDGMSVVGGSIIHGLSRGRLGRGFGRGMQGLGVLSAPVDTAIGGSKVQNRLDTARSIERGEPEPGKEDRKHGGKVCRAEGGPVGGLSNKDGGAGGASGRLAKIKEYGK